MSILFRKWEKMSLDQRVEWCIKWFKIALVLISIQAVLKIIETGILISFL